MGKVLRILGISCVLVGVLILLAQVVDPLGALLTAIRDAFIAAPTWAQVATSVIALGLALAFGSVIIDRIEDSKKEKDLLKD